VFVPDDLVVGGVNIRPSAVSMPAFHTERAMILVGSPGAGTGRPLPALVLQAL
jgi:hypothetical protein